MHLFPNPTRLAIGSALAAFAAALAVALAGPALAGSPTGSPVNIVDPTTAADIAHVNSLGELEITGLVTIQQSPAADFFHQSTFAVSGGTCETIATPPSGKALIIKEVRIDVFSDPSPGGGQNAPIFTGSSDDCATQVGDVNPPTVGQFVVPFDPGLGIPVGTALNARCNGQLECEFYVDGFVVAAGDVPSSGVIAPVAGPSQQHR
jgi:hypothetical protein